jgi:hypothetical protein
MDASSDSPLIPAAGAERFLFGQRQRPLIRRPSLSCPAEAGGYWGEF